MPPKKHNFSDKINKITVKESNISQFNNILSNSNSKNLAKLTKTINKNEEDDDDGVDDEESENDSYNGGESDVEETVKNSDEEDEDNLDDDNLEEKEDDKNMKDKDDIQDENDLDDYIQDDIVDDDKSVDEDKISGSLDIADCLLDEDIVVDEIGEPTMVDPDKRVSRPVLTKYERVRLLSARTKQLALGAPPFVKNVSNKSQLEIAEIELHFNMIPFKIKRPMPNNTYEIWKLSELQQ